MTELRSIQRTFRSFRQIGWRRRALIVEAAVWLALARLALAAFPFPTLARRLGAFVPPGDPPAFVRECACAPGTWSRSGRPACCG